MNGSEVRRSVYFIIPVVLAIVAWTAVLPAVASTAGTISSPTPCPHISPKLQLRTTTPVLLVHGFNEGPGVFTTGSPSLESAISHAVGSSVTLVTFDYSEANTQWVTSASIGPVLAQCIIWLAHRSDTQGGPGKVIIVAHSMGGLAVRCAVDPACVKGNQAADPSLIGLVVTLGAPNTGSLLGNFASFVAAGYQASNAHVKPAGPFESVEAALCKKVRQCPQLAAGITTPAAQAMQIGSAALNPDTLKPLPSSILLDAIAGKITLTTTLMDAVPFAVPIGDIGDLAVPVASAQDPQGPSHPGPGNWQPTIDCGSIPVGSLPEWIAGKLAGQQPLVKCWHETETTDPAWQSNIITAIKSYLAASTCSPTALTKALAVANPQLNSISWKLKSYACASGWAVVQIYAPAVGNGTAFLQQTASGWNSDALGEVNCADIPGPLGTPLPAQALTASLLSKAGICASGNVNPPRSAPLPDFYYANAVLPEKLYVSPTYPKELAIDNHDGIAIQTLDAWGPASMTMTGVLTYDECRPDCAAGPTVTFPVRVIAAAPQTCTLRVDQQGSTLPEKAYVYNDITVKALSGNPPTQLVGSSVMKVCKAAPTQQRPTQQSLAPFAVTSSSPTSGPASGGTLIVIHGSGFSSVTKVVMNSIEPPLPEGNPNYYLQNLHPRFSVASDSEIDMTTTAGAAGFTYQIDFITLADEFFRNTFPGIPIFTYK